jgi:hypothetical protein
MVHRTYLRHSNVLEEVMGIAIGGHQHKPFFDSVRSLTSTKGSVTTTDVVARMKKEKFGERRKNVDVPNASASVKKSYSKGSLDGLVNVTKSIVEGAVLDIIMNGTLTVLCVT